MRLELHGESIISNDSIYLVSTRFDEAQHPFRNPTLAQSIADALAAVLQVRKSSDFVRLASANRSERPEVLSLILQRDVTVDLQRAREALNIQIEEDEFAPPPVPLPPVVIMPDPPNQDIQLPLRLRLRRLSLSHLRLYLSR